MRFYVLGFVSLCLPTTLSAQPQLSIKASLPNTAAELVEQIQDMLPWKESPGEAGYSPSISEAYEALFKKVGPAGIHKLQSSSSDSVAIRAAWEEVAMTVPEQEPARAVRPDHDKLVWFLGFLEGRSRCKAPQWWADSLIDSRANRRDNIYPGAFSTWPYHDSGLDQVRAPRDTGLKRDGDQVVLHVGSKSSPIPDDILIKATTRNGQEFCCNVSALMTPLRCYVAVHGGAGHPHQLVCIDRQSAKLRWEARVWGNFWGYVGGRSSMSVSIVEENDRVMVFGASLGMNVEAFRATDGANLFRFATTY